MISLSVFMYAWEPNNCIRFFGVSHRCVSSEGVVSHQAFVRNDAESVDVARESARKIRLTRAKEKGLQEKKRKERKKAAAAATAAANNN